MKSFLRLMILTLCGLWHGAVVAESLLPQGSPKTLLLGMGAGYEQYAERSTIEVEHPLYATAERFRVLKVPEQIYHIQVNQRSTRPIAKGDTLRVRMIFRSGDPAGTLLRLPFFVQDREKGFRSLFNREFSAGKDWQEEQFLFPITEDLAAGRIQFCLFLGQGLQVLDLARFEVDNLGPNPDAAALIPDAARKVSVQGDYLPVKAAKAGITGALPSGWMEDSSWADVDVHYRVQEVNPYAGDRSLRVEVGSLRNGLAQFLVPGLRVAPSHLMRIRIPLRSEDNRSVTLTLRKRNAPYTVYWQNTLTARPEWGLYEVLASLRETDPDAGLFFSMNTPGTMEISDFTIEYLTPDQALEGQSFAGNLLQSSSFPVGLSAPWACGANGTRAEQLGADPSVPGPSGGPALRLVPHTYEGSPVMQISAPFTGKPGAVHTFSLWAKSDKPGMVVNLRMGPPKERLWVAPWQKALTLSTEWTRYEMSVLLPAAPDLIYLARVNSHDSGTFWIDQVMVEVGDKAGVFQRGGDIEVHAVPRKPLGVYFEADTLSLRVALLGETARAARLEGSILDLYGDEQKLPDVPLKVSGAVHSFDLALPRPARLGSFLVTLRAVDAGGNRLSKDAEVLVHRVREPRHWGRPAPDSPFGTHVYATEDWLQTAKALGFNWNRMHYGFNWNSLQKADGTWDFQKTDDIIALHQQQQMLILTHLGGVPARHSVVNSNWDGANSWYRTTAAPRMDAMDAFEEYCRELLRHAGNSLQAVEVWNEPFLPGFFVGNVENGRPVREKPEVLVEMFQRARKAADATGYTGKLFWNTGPHYGESEKAFDTAVRDLGGAGLVDSLSFHRYINSNLAFPGDRFAEDMRIIRDTFAGAPAAREIWNSEGGHGLSEIFNLYRNVPPYRQRVRADMQANQYVRYFLSNLAAGADKVFIYTFYAMDRWVSDYGYHNVDGTLSQIAPATSNMAWQLEGTRFERMWSPHEGVYAQLYVSKTGGENVVVLLPNGRSPALLRHVSDGVSISDVYGNAPVLPYSFSAGLLYLRGPGLDADTASAILNAATPAELPVITATPTPSPSVAPASAPTGAPLPLLGIGVIALLLAFWMVRLILARK